jgi:hypothetical protein
MRGKKIVSTGVGVPRPAVAIFQTGRVMPDTGVRLPLACTGWDTGPIPVIRKK